MTWIALLLGALLTAAVALAAVWGRRSAKLTRENQQLRDRLDDVEAARCRSQSESRILRRKLESVGDQVARSHEVDARARRLAERNDVILRTSMDGFFVVGEDYRFLEVNQAFAGMLGYTVDELLSMTIVELEAPDEHRAHGSSFARTGLHQFPTAHRHRDGHIVHLEISVIVLRDEGRRIVVGFARDVTERRRAEAALTELTRQKRLILHSAGEGICGVDTNGLVTFANPAAARMLKRTPGEMIGRPLAEILQPSSAAGSQADDLTAAIRGLRACHLAEADFVRAGGDRFPAEYSATPIEENGEVLGAVVVFNDISARKRAEEERRRLELQLRHNEKLEGLGLLAGGIAHDFNNILVGILGNACLALEELDADSPVRTRIQRIVNAGQRASKVIHQILAYAGQARLDAQPVDLNELAAESIEFHRASFPQNVAVRLDLASDLPTLSADGGQIEQLLSNLVINAVEAIGDAAGTVVIRTRSVELGEEDSRREYPGQDLRAGLYVALEVEDDGPGMSAETLNRIFEPFYSSKATGRGLGLAAIRGIVKAHEGGIVVRSQRGVGTLFRVLLPAAGVGHAAMATTANEPPTREPAAAAPAARQTILVIDDEEDIRDIVQAGLEARGLRVWTAENGERGIELFRSRADEIDLVLLDLTMPGLDGCEVLDAILTIRPDARVVLSSGFSEGEAASRVGTARLAGFIHKPYTMDALTASVRQALAGDPARSRGPDARAAVAGAPAGKCSR